MVEKIKSIKDIVMSLLQRFPDTRDNDRLLLIYVWASQDRSLKDNAYAFRQFGLNFIKGDYADAESVRRTRQKIQESHPELRGKSYAERIGRLKEEMIQEMQSLIM